MYAEFLKKRAFLSCVHKLVLKFKQKNYATNILFLTDISH
ncbi:hypothetical protein PI23P_10435 [Polaribacter irgensii 23-P]|uniref:Uncharacterized protein n=1 Tax=Polaribacter irgensii 23-P TaxID=313594 RepID=A4C0U6_9FLAO|nr:hypothetical protein PI23P_10435 [Polaribacter irgensii 23-P]